VSLDEDSAASLTATHEEENDDDDTATKEPPPTCPELQITPNIGGVALLDCTPTTLQPPVLLEIAQTWNVSPFNMVRVRLPEVTALPPAM
jgi:hypothetical protein